METCPRWLALEVPVGRFLECYCGPLEFADIYRF